MERVKKGENYWFIDLNFEVTLSSYGDQREPTDNWLFQCGNYFATEAEAEAMATKLRAVLKGAEVIEMPTDEELQAAEDNYIGHPYQLDEGVTTSMCRTAFGAGIEWISKSKIVK